MYRAFRHLFRPRIGVRIVGGAGGNQPPDRGQSRVLELSWQTGAVATGEWHTVPTPGARRHDLDPAGQVHVRDLVAVLPTKKIRHTKVATAGVFCTTGHELQKTKTGRNLDLNPEIVPCHCLGSL